MQPKISDYCRNIGLKLLCGGVLFTSLCGLDAADLFSVSGTTTDALPTVHTTVTGSSLLDLVENAINAQGEFLQFQNRDFEALLDYAGVANAMRFTIVDNSLNGGGVTTRLEAISGLDRTFSGATREDVEDQIEEFLKKEGSSEYARFLKAISEQSKVAITDGNPYAATAQIANQAFMQFGNEIGETREEKERGDQGGGFGIGFNADVGTFKAGGIEGNAYQLPLYAKWAITDRVAVQLNIPLSYISIESANVFGAGLGLGVPIKVIKRTKENPWLWQVTPSGGAFLTGSEDMVAGGALAQGGLTSLLSYDWDWITVSMGNHFSVMEGLPIEFADVNIDPGVSQQILKNGLKASVPLGRRWVAEAYGIYTRFLEKAAVEDYFTLGGDIAFRLSAKPGKSGAFLRAGLYTHIGSDFESAGIQFGTGWKF